MAPKSKGEDDDPDWAPKTPDIQAKKTASSRLRAPPPKRSANNGKQCVRVRKNNKTHELKILQPSLKKKRRKQMRMPLNKLVELARRMAHDLRDFDCTALHLSWMNVKRERSNTATRRQDFSSLFAAPIVGQVRVERTTRFKPGEKLIVYERKGKRNKTKSAVDVGKQEMDSDAADPSMSEQKGCAVVETEQVMEADAADPSMSEQKGCAVVETEQVMEADAADPSMSEQKGCAVVETEQVMEAEPVAYPSNRVEESGNEANALPKRFKKHIPSGKSQSLIDTLMEKKKNPTPKPTLKRHRPKVVDDQMSSTSTPNPQTPKPNVKMPKPAREVKVKRKLDFSNESSNTKDQEELKFQDSSSERTSIAEVSNQQVSIVPSTTTHRSEFKTNNVLLIQDEAIEAAMVDYATHKMASLSIAESIITDLVVRDSKKFDPSKTYKAEIDFHPESVKAWELLMGHNWSEYNEAQGSSDNGEYMRKERKLFRDRVDLFLARMRFYQGDRQFSPWKGSVVDSIVGVFLTQNVSDYLSSNAYMSLASAYPPLSVSEQNSQLARENKQFLLENGNESSSVMKMKIEVEAAQVTPKGKGKGKQEIPPINWDELRIEYSHGIPIKREDHNADSVNWEAVRQSSPKDLAKVYEYRGMSNQLAGRIQGFLHRLVRDHGSIDLEWLRKVPPSKAKDYLLSFNGLGLKSTECVRLLALHFPSFPVDTNAGRFFVRVGWAPLKPLPDSVRMHLLNSYPLLDSVQKYIWPRICDRDKLTLYEFHCHSVTIAKSFCTKVKPNCNHCPMRGECKHYESASKSFNIHLEGSQAKSYSGSCSPMSSQEAPMLTNFDVDKSEEPYYSCNSEPIIEFPASPGPTPDSTSETITQFEMDMEDFGHEIPTIKLNGIDLSEKIRNYTGDYEELSKALVSASPSVGSIPMARQKQTLRLRTVHIVYELPDSHPLLAEFENREPEDPCPYLLAIWPTDETKNSGSKEVVVPFVNHDRIQGTILIPCRTANRGRFPLNGTYFQTNEVFADHASSRQPIDFPAQFIWNLNKRMLYCGTSITSICRGMSDVEIGLCFQMSYICVRGFDRRTRTALYIKERFHRCKSRKPETDE